MSQFSQEQFAAAQKNHIDTFFSVTNKFFEGLEKLAHLNLQAAKSILTETQESAQKALSVKDATHDAVVKAAEAQLAEYNQHAQTFVDGVAKNAPAGSEAAVALLKSTITAAHTAYDTVNKATRQVVDIAENNFQAATVASSKARENAAHAARAAKTA